MVHIRSAQVHLSDRRGSTKSWPRRTTPHCEHAGMNARTHSLTHARTHARAHERTDGRTDGRTQARTQTHTHALTRYVRMACARACTRAHALARSSGEPKIILPRVVHSGPYPKIRSTCVHSCTHARVRAGRRRKLNLKTLGPASLQLIDDATQHRTWHGTDTNWRGAAQRGSMHLPAPYSAAARHGTGRCRAVLALTRTHKRIHRA